MVLIGNGCNRESTRVGVENHGLVLIEMLEE
jgi:hypothetical protein